MENVLKLSGEFSDCLDEIENGSDHLFITGKAGTGKSTLLDLFRRSTRKNIAILAPTGIAALRVQGQTIHSFFKFPPRLILPSDISHKPALARLVKKLEIIALDEISMVRADVLDGIDLMLRLHKKDPRPFGGVRLVVFGDIYQLPPIISSTEERRFFQTEYASPYFFASHVWQLLEPNLQYINLTTVYRQTDRAFIRLLDDIRNGDPDYDTLSDLNERVDPQAEDEGYIHLSPRNMTMQRINQQKLDSLSGEERTYLGTITGDYNAQYMPADPVLRLKEGAQVIFVKNDPERVFVNGSLGIITLLDTNSIRVRLTGGQEVEVARASWDMIRYRLEDGDESRIRPEVIGSYEQFPLKLAWAMSIHKSQGQTFDRVILDMEGGAFEYGQTYVALSRCRTLEGIILKRPLRPQDIMVDPRVVDFYINRFRG